MFVSFHHKLLLLQDHVAESFKFGCYNLLSLNHASLVLLVVFSADNTVKGFQFGQCRDNLLAL